MAVGDTSTATHLAHTQHNTQRDHLMGLGYGVAAGALWGVIFVAPKMLPQFSPLALSAARYVLYGVLSLMMAMPVWRALWRKTTRRDWATLLLLSLPGNLLYYLCVAGGVQRAGVAPVSLIVGLLPVTVTLAGAAERGSLPLRRLALPLLMAVAGVVCIYLDAPDMHSHAGGSAYLIGLLMAAGALACWTVYAVCNARYLRTHPQFTSREWSLLTGIATGALSLALAVPAFVVPGMATASAQPASVWGRFWLVNAGVALGASVLGNSLWNAASRKLPLTLSGQLIVFETLFALLYGFVYEGRLPHGLEVVAALLLVGGVGLAAQRHV